MSFLVDTDTCSAYLKNHPRVVSRVMLHYGALDVSVVTVGELLTWGLRANAPSSRLRIIRAFLQGVTVLEATLPVAEKFGSIRAGLLDRGITVSGTDLFIAATALVHNLTLVTHNTADYANVPGLTLEDWMTP
jgi:tRNA(fMet)-specific endonuclease VapC